MVQEYLTPTLFIYDQSAHSELLLLDRSEFGPYFRRLKATPTSSKYIEQRRIIHVTTWKPKKRAPVP